MQRKINLVYGGGSIGLMGKIAQTVDAGGGHVIGYVSSLLFLSGTSMMVKCKHELILLLKSLEEISIQDKSRRSAADLQHIIC